MESKARSCPFKNSACQAMPQCALYDSARERCWIVSLGVYQGILAAIAQKHEEIMKGPLVKDEPSVKD